MAVCAFRDMSNRSSRMRQMSMTTLLCLSATTTAAQEYRGAILADAGVASIGHADSEQGNAALLGGGVSFRLAPWLVAEGELHRAHVSRVFGRDDHDFTESTLTGSVLFRAHRGGRAHLLAGGGFAVQRARSEFDAPPIGSVDIRETVRLWHGRTGIEWDAFERVVVRTDAVLWFGAGVDWILGGLVRVGYRF